MADPADTQTLDDQAPGADPAPGACLHCDLPVAPAPDGRPLFCCVGCRLAHSVAAGPDGQRRFLEARLLLAAILSMGVMTFSLVLYGEDVHDVLDSEDLAAVRNVGRGVLALFALPVAALLMPPLLLGAWQDLVARRLRMDGLIVVAVAAGYGLSLHATWTGTGDVYFETATMVLVLVTFGRRLEAHARTHGQDAAEVLAELAPGRARRHAPDGTLEEVAPADLARGDRLHLGAGETVPADCRVAAGTSQVSCAHVTGESTPRAVATGDPVPAGALNGPGALELVVEAVGEDDTLGRIQALLSRPLPATAALRMADRWAGRIAALALVLAVLGGLRSGLEGGAWPGLRTTLSVLLVACPCALGLAMPLAYRALRVALARHGVLVEDVAQLEAAARTDVVLLDKTGTLTEPSGGWSLLWEAPGIQASRADDDGPAGPDRAAGDADPPVGGPHAGDTGRAAGDADPDDGGLSGSLSGSASGSPSGSLSGGPSGSPSGSALLLELLAFSGHPLGRQAAATRATPPEDLQVRPGGGLIARWRGATWRLGKPSFVAPDWPAAAQQALGASGDSVVALARDDRPLALIAVRQQLRPGAAAAVADLSAAGPSLEIVSGDRDAAVAEIGDQLGVPARSGLDPAGKLARLGELQAAGRRVMAVGDGLNDAPLLRAADVGVVMGSGSATAKAQAGLHILGDDLAGLVALHVAARQLRRTVRGNIAWTLVYNGAALVAAASGQLHPLMAVAAMILSSLVVSVRSYRLLDWTPDGSPPPSRTAPSAAPARPAAGSPDAAAQPA